MNLASGLLRRIVVGTALLSLGSALAACKAGRWRQQEKNGGAAAVSVPTRVDADQPPTSAGPGFDVDERTGKAKADLVLRLDHFPDEAAPGAANLPVCFAPLPADFVLGTVWCDGDEATKKPLVAGNVTQQCYTDPSVLKVAPSAPLILASCRRGATLLGKFAPTLQLDVELKDVATAQ